MIVRIFLFLFWSAMPELRTDIEIIVADVSIDESLAIMCQQGLVILNCVGPVSVPSRLCAWVKGNLAVSLPCPPLPLPVQVLWWTGGQSMYRKWCSLPGHLWRAPGRQITLLSCVRPYCICYSSTHFILSSWSECSWSTTPRPWTKASMWSAAVVSTLCQLIWAFCILGGSSKVGNRRGRVSQEEITFC